MMYKDENPIGGTFNFIANSILQSLGLSSLFNDNKQEPEQIQLEDLGLLITTKEKYWRFHHNLTHRIPNTVVQYSKTYWNRFQQQFSKIHMRIGLLNVDSGYNANSKYMGQLPDVRLIPLNIKLNDYFQNA